MEEKAMKLERGLPERVEQEQRSNGSRLVPSDRSIGFSLDHDSAEL